MTSISIRDAIQSAASALVGKSAWDCKRAGDMAMFQFGARRIAPSPRGVMREVGEYALHLQCPWRIRKRDEIIMAALDVYHPQTSHEDEDGPDFDWEHGNLLDERTQMFFENGAREYRVERVEAGDAGALCILLQGDLWFEICPCNSDQGEHWRLFQPSNRS